MDQEAFRETYWEVNDCFCAFEKSVLTHQCDCSQAEKFCIAEREGVRCSSKAHQTRCLDLLDVLRKQAHFALRTPKEDTKLPHGKAMRIQVGGMRGIRALLTPDIHHSDPIEDIQQTLNQAEARFGSLEAMPFSHIMPSIAAYQGRIRRRKHDHGSHDSH